jgi:hypothetical protein
MICGACSREQPFAPKCNACGLDVSAPLLIAAATVPATPLAHFLCSGSLSHVC